MTKRKLEDLDNRELKQLFNINSKLRDEVKKDYRNFRLTDFKYTVTYLKGSCTFKNEASKGKKIEIEINNPSLFIQTIQHLVGGYKFFNKESLVIINKLVDIKNKEDFNRTKYEEELKVILFDLVNILELLRRDSVPLSEVEDFFIETYVHILIDENTYVDSNYNLDKHYK